MRRDTEQPSQQLKTLTALLAIISLLSSSVPVHAQVNTRVMVTIENVAPQQGTFQTPFWVGFHDGSFDTYDGNTPASNVPRPGSVAMERLCEDGDTGPISEDFAALVPAGVDTTLAGPNGPIAPGDIAIGSFVLDPSDPNSRYFSYASMIIPSNDFCLSNGNPLAHPIFDAAGNFIAEPFFVIGEETLDAGTEVNDELPDNTAFFGQQMPNTGVDENGLIGTLGSDILEVMGFLPPGSGGILDDPRFAMADFSLPGYPFVKISFATAPAITDDRTYDSFLSGAEEVPAVQTAAFASAVYTLREEGTRLAFRHLFQRFFSASSGLPNVVGAHLHLAPEGQNGPIVAILLGDTPFLSESVDLEELDGELTARSLTGPLAGQPLDALIAEIEAGNVYINIHTEDFQSGEIRGQLSRR
jgi:hypothetical protein